MNRSEPVWKLVYGVERHQHVNVRRCTVSYVSSICVLCIHSHSDSHTHTHTRTVVLECPVLDDPPNGMVTITDMTPGSVAIYLCAPGFRLEGEGTRVCGRVREKEAEWSGEEPICESEL